MHIVNSTSDDWKVPVECAPLVQAFPAFGEVEEFKEKQVVLTQDHKRLFSVVSNKAVVVPHTDALETVSAAVKNAYGQEPEINLVVLKEGASIRAKFEMPWLEPIEIEKGDLVNQHLFLYNSYSRAVPFKLRVGFFRVLCMNGMLAGDNIASLTSKQLLDGWSPDGLVEKIKVLLETSRKCADLWETWKNVPLKWEDVEVPLERRFPNKLIKSLEPSNFPMTMWDLYMDLTNRVTHNSGTQRTQVNLDSVVSTLFYNPTGPLKEVYKKMPQLEKVAA